MEASGLAAAPIAQRQGGALLDSAVEKIARGDTEGGRAEAERLVFENGGDSAALRVIGQSFLAEGDYKQAEHYFARGSAFDPESAALRSDLAAARRLQNSDEEILADGRDMLSDPVRRTDGLRLLANLVSRSPSNVDAYLALADGFSVARKPGRVLGALREAVRVAGDDRIDDVISASRAFVEDHPQTGIPRNVLGRALQKAGRWDEAIMEFKAAAGFVPYNVGFIEDLADAHIARAEAKLAGGNGLTARSDVDAARAIDPGNVGLGEAEARLAADRAGRAVASRQYNKALVELRKAASGAPEEVRFKKEVAALYVRVGQHFKSEGGDSVALSSFEKAYELDPTSTISRRNVGELSHKIGLSAFGAGNYDRAITYLDNAYGTYRPDDTYGEDLARAYDLRGQLLRGAGKLDAAIEDFTEALSLDPSSSSISANLSAAVLEKNGW